MNGEKTRVFKIRNDDDLLLAVKTALDRIRTTTAGYGQIKIIVSGGEAKHINIEIPLTED